MIILNRRRNIIAKLNSFFEDYSQLRLFCDFLSNDIYNVEKMISKIIKYSFVSDDFICFDETLAGIIKKTGNVDNLYSNYLSKTKHQFPSFSSNVQFGVSLDEDIRVSDLVGLKLPSKDRINEICNQNIAHNQDVAMRKERMNRYYNSQISFPEVGLTYSRMELVRINSKFPYFHKSLTGDIYRDYKKLYQDERYGSLSENNPLNNSFYDNLDNIIKKNDIQLKKLGNLYIIENGRHRILYIMSNDGDVLIPACVTRRIEDREFNIILKKLRSKFDVVVYKNNILNDEANILIVYKGIIYCLKNKEDLKKFYYNLNNDINNEEFSLFDFQLLPIESNGKLMFDYKKIILEKSKELGDFIITSNFSDIIPYFDCSYNSLFYEAFLSLQFGYQSTNLYQKKDFGFMDDIGEDSENHDIFQDFGKRR